MKLMQLFKSRLQKNQKISRVLMASEAKVVKAFRGHFSVLLLSDISVLTRMTPSDTQYIIDSLAQKGLVIEEKQKIELTKLGKSTLYALTNPSFYSSSIIVVDDLDKEIKLADLDSDDIDDQLDKEIFKLTDARLKYNS